MTRKDDAACTDWVRPVQVIALAGGPTGEQLTNGAAPVNDTNTCPAVTAEAHDAPTAWRSKLN